MLHVIMLRIVPGISIHMQLCCLFQAVVTIHIYIYIFLTIPEVGKSKIKVPAWGSGKSLLPALWLVSRFYVLTGEKSYPSLWLLFYKALILPMWALPP